MNITWAGLLFVWNGIWGFLNSIPSSFWGVVAGALLSLAGIRFTNKATLQRLRVQLESDRLLKAEERRMTIRRDAYLHAAEHVAFGINTLPTFGNLDRDVTKLDLEYQAKAGIFARVYAIATAELTGALMEMAHAIGEGLLSGYSQRMRLAPKMNRRDALRSQQTRMLQEQSRWLEELKSFNLSGAADPARGEVISRNFQFATDRVTEINAELDILGAELLREQLAISKVQLDAAEKCNLLVPQLLKAMRQELDFEYEGEKIENLMRHSIRMQRKAITEFIASVEAMIPPQAAITTSEESHS